MMNDQLISQVAQQVQQKYYGKFRGVVTKNNDPQRRGRLRLLIPSVLGDQETGWALPCVPFGGFKDQGFFMLPEPDAIVWVEFEEGDLSRPIWTGTLWQESEDVPALPEDGALPSPNTRLIKTPSGHVLQFDDKKGEEKFLLHHPKGTEIELNEAGTVSLTDANGATVVLDAQANSITIQDTNGNTLTMDSTGTTAVDANGNTIHMATAGVTVKGQKIVINGNKVALGAEGGEPLVKGMSLMALFNSHTHVGSGGSTSPPTTPMTPAQLSNIVTTT